MLSKEREREPHFHASSIMTPMNKGSRAVSYTHARSDSNVRFLMETNKNLLLENEEFKKELFKLGNDKAKMATELKSTHKFYSELVDIQDMSDEDGFDGDVDVDKLIKHNQDLKAQNSILLRQQKESDKSVLEMQSKLDATTYKLHNMKELHNEIAQLKADIAELQELKEECDDEIVIKNQELKTEKLTVERLKKQMDEYLQSVELAMSAPLPTSKSDSEGRWDMEGKQEILERQLEEANSKVSTLQTMCETQNEKLLNLRTDYDLLEKDRNRWIRKCEMFESKSNCNFLSNMFQ